MSTHTNRRQGPRVARKQASNQQSTHQSSSTAHSTSVSLREKLHPLSSTTSAPPPPNPTHHHPNTSPPTHAQPPTPQQINLSASNNLLSQTSTTRLHRLTDQLNPQPHGVTTKFTISGPVHGPNTSLAVSDIQQLPPVLKPQQHQQQHQQTQGPLHNTSTLHMHLQPPFQISQNPQHPSLPPPAPRPPTLTVHSLNNTSQPLHRLQPPTHQTSTHHLHQDSQEPESTTTTASTLDDENSQPKVLHSTHRHHVPHHNESSTEPHPDNQTQNQPADDLQHADSTEKSVAASDSKPNKRSRNNKRDNRHDPNHQSSKPGSTLYKTEMCRTFQEGLPCPYGDRCMYGHGDDELRLIQRHPRYKTEVCRNFQQGYCKYGARCVYRHEDLGPSGNGIMTSNITTLTDPDASIFDIILKTDSLFSNATLQNNQPPSIADIAQRLQDPVPSKSKHHFDQPTTSPSLLPRNIIPPLPHGKDNFYFSSANFNQTLPYPHSSQTNTSLPSSSLDQTPQQTQSSEQPAAPLSHQAFHTTTTGLAVTPLIPPQQDVDYWSLYANRNTFELETFQQHPHLQQQLQQQPPQQEQTSTGTTIIMNQALSASTGKKTPILSYRYPYTSNPLDLNQASHINPNADFPLVNPSLTPHQTARKTPVFILDRGDNIIMDFFALNQTQMGASQPTINPSHSIYNPLPNTNTTLPPSQPLPAEQQFQQPPSHAAHLINSDLHQPLPLAPAVPTPQPYQLQVLPRVSSRIDIPTHETVSKHSERFFLQPPPVNAAQAFAFNATALPPGSSTFNATSLMHPPTTNAPAQPPSRDPLANSSFKSHLVPQNLLLRPSTPSKDPTSAFNNPHNMNTQVGATMPTFPFGAINPVSMNPTDANQSAAVALAGNSAGTMWDDFRDFTGANASEKPTRRLSFSKFSRSPSTTAIQQYSQQPAQFDHQQLHQQQQLFRQQLDQLQTNQDPYNMYSNPSRQYGPNSTGIQNWSGPAPALQPIAPFIPDLHPSLMESLPVPLSFMQMAQPQLNQRQTDNVQSFNPPLDPSEMSTLVRSTPTKRQNKQIQQATSHSIIDSSRSNLKAVPFDPSDLSTLYPQQLPPHLPVSIQTQQLPLQQQQQQQQRQPQQQQLQQHHQHHHLQQHQQLQLQHPLQLPQTIDQPLMPYQAHTLPSLPKQQQFQHLDLPIVPMPAMALPNSLRHQQLQQQQQQHNMINQLQPPNPDHFHQSQQAQMFEFSVDPWGFYDNSAVVTIPSFQQPFPAADPVQNLFGAASNPATIATEPYHGISLSSYHENGHVIQPLTQKPLQTAYQHPFHFELPSLPETFVLSSINTAALVGTTALSTMQSDNGHDDHGTSLHQLQQQALDEMAASAAEALTDNIVPLSFE